MTTLYSIRITAEEKKFISLELAKKICKTAKSKSIELPNSNQNWFEPKLRPYKSKIIQKDHQNEFDNSERWMRSCDIYPAYDIYELGKMLPNSLGIGTKLQFQKTREDKFYIQYMNYGEGFEIHSELGNEPEARGKMLLYLLENNLLKL